MRFVILTGMSGAGKSTALKMMEDIGYFCVDNLPIALLEKFSELTETEDAGLDKVAVGVDIRSGQRLNELESVLTHMKERGIAFEILFLDAEDIVLVRRYKETRRSHPLAIGERVDKGISLERQRVEFLRRQADFIIDTSQLLTRELKVELEKIFVRNQDYRSLYVTILSFGFKYGIPADSDLVFDVPHLLRLLQILADNLKMIRLLRVAHGTGGQKGSPDKSPLAADILNQNIADQSLPGQDGSGIVRPLDSRQYSGELLRIFHFHGADFIFIEISTLAHHKGGGDTESLF